MFLTDSPLPLPSHPLVEQQVYDLDALWPQHHKTKKSQSGVVYDFSSCPLAKNRHNTKVLRKVLGTLLKRPDSWLFSKPVAPVELGVPDYFDIIKEPMDLGTVLKKLDEGRYEHVAQFLHDISLIWSNALKYNTEDSEVAKIARAMRDNFDAAFENIENQLGGSTFISRKELALSGPPPPNRKQKRLKRVQAEQHHQTLEQPRVEEAQLGQHAAQMWPVHLQDEQQSLPEKLEEHRKKQENLMAQHKKQLDELEQGQLKKQFELQQQQQAAPRGSAETHQQERMQQQHQQQMQQEKLLLKQLEELQQHQAMQPPDVRHQMEQLKREREHSAGPLDPQQQMQLNQVRPVTRQATQ